MLPWTSAPDIFTHCTSFHSSGFHLRDGGRCLGSRQKQKPPIADGREVKQVREYLKYARKAKGMTQQAVADYLGITLNYYQKLEEGSRDGNFGIWDSLEDLTGIHQRVLRCDSDTRPVPEDNP